MPASEPLDILLAHDRWATAQLFDACATLSDDQFHRRFDIGPGSLHDALTHILGATRIWTDTLVGREPRPRPESDGQRRTPAQLRQLFVDAWAELSAESRRRPLDELATRRTATGRILTLTRGAVLMQVATHAMHHRAQCLNMLRQLGVTSLPASSVAEWTWMGDK